MRKTRETQTKTSPKADEPVSCNQDSVGAVRSGAVVKSMSPNTSIASVVAVVAGDVTNESHKFLVSSLSVYKKKIKKLLNKKRL